MYTRFCFWRGLYLLLYFLELFPYSLNLKCLQIATNLFLHLWERSARHRLSFASLQQTVQILNYVFGCKLCLLPV